MIEYDRIDLDEGIGLNKTFNCRECWLCNFQYFLEKISTIRKYYCDGCHDMSMKTVSIKNLAIVYSKRNAYRIHFWNISKDDAINIMHCSNLIDKRCFIIFLYKMSEITYYQRN